MNAYGTPQGPAPGMAGGWYVPPAIPVGGTYGIGQAPYPTPTQTKNVDAGIIWVENEEEAANYPVAPNVALPLWDKRKPMIYLKSADSLGMPSYKRISYAVESEQSSSPIQAVGAQQIDPEKFAPAGVVSVVENLVKEVNGLKVKLADSTPIEFPEDKDGKK